MPSAWARTNDDFRLLWLGLFPPVRRQFERRQSPWRTTVGRAANRQHVLRRDRQLRPCRSCRATPTATASPANSPMTSNQFETTFASRSPCAAQGDLVPNGIVDFDDFRQWKTAFLAGGGSLAGLDLGLFNNIPEPATFVLAFVPPSSYSSPRGANARHSSGQFGCHCCACPAVLSRYTLAASPSTIV